MKRIFAALLIAATSPFASGQTVAFNLDAVTRLANGVLAGQNVNSPISGFDIRLLRGGEVVYHQSFGSWTLNQPARCASATKTLTGALMMSVAQTSQLPFSLDTSLSTLLPSFDVPGKRGITIRNAFSHTSGLPGSEANAVLSNPDITLQESAAQIATLPMVNAPSGTKFSYGGLSMQAAGAAAEVATGQSFVDLLASRITQPLGMTQTRFVTASQSNPRVAGGAESTATDFTRFMDTLLNSGVDRQTGARILDDQSVQTMFTRQTTDSQPVVFSPVDNNRYGVGVWLDQQFVSTLTSRVDVLAAGASGFHAWIDYSDNAALTFSTDRSPSFENLELVSALIHDAVEASFAQPRLAGDANLNGGVDFNDLVALAVNYNSFNRLWTQGDFTGDGIVNFNDLVGLAVNYDASPGRSFDTDWQLAISWVPEPISLGLIGLGLFAMARRRDRRGEPPSRHPGTSARQRRS